MSVVASLKLVEFKPEHAHGAVFVRRRKLADKIDQQIALASDPAYTPTKIIMVKDESGVEQRRQVPKRIKRWWVTNIDGTVQLTIRYGSKLIELAKGKNAIECAALSDLAPTLATVKEAVLNGDLDSAVQSIAGFGRKAKKALV